MEDQTPPKTIVDPSPAAPIEPTPSTPTPNKIKRILFIITALIMIPILLLGGKYFLDEKKAKAITDFAGCQKAGYPVLKTYPGQCSTPDGRKFVQVLTEAEKQSLKPPTDEIANSNSIGANWKTYSSPKDNYSLKHPATWNLEAENSSVIIRTPDFADSTASEIEPYQIINTGTQIVIDTSSSIPKQNQTLMDYVKDHFAFIDEGIKSVILDNTDAVKAEGTMNFGTKQQGITNYYILYKNKMYTISRTYVKSQKAQYENEFDQILQTFKFTE